MPCINTVKQKQVNKGFNALCVEGNSVMVLKNNPFKASPSVLSAEDI